MHSLTLNQVTQHMVQQVRHQVSVLYTVQSHLNSLTLVTQHMVHQVRHQVSVLYNQMCTL